MIASFVLIGSSQVNADTGLVKGIWTDNPKACTAFWKALPQNRIHLGNSQHMYISQSEIHFAGGHESSDCTLSSIRTRRSVFDAVAACREEEDERQKKRMRIVKSGKRAVIIWQHGRGEYRERIFHCATFKDLGRRFSALWRTNDNDCTVTVPYEGENIVFSQSAIGELQVSIPPPKFLVLNSSDSLVSVSVDRVKLKPVAARSVGNKLVIPLGQFAFASKLISSGVDLAFRGGTRNNPIFGNYLLFGSSKGMEFLARCNKTHAGSSIVEPRCHLQHRRYELTSNPNFVIQFSAPTGGNTSDSPTFTILHKDNAFMSGFAAWSNGFSKLYLNVTSPQKFSDDLIMLSFLDKSLREVSSDDPGQAVLIMQGLGRAMHYSRRDGWPPEMITTVSWRFAGCS